MCCLIGWQSSNFCINFSIELSICGCPEWSELTCTLRLAIEQFQSLRVDLLLCMILTFYVLGHSSAIDGMC